MLRSHAGKDATETYASVGHSNAAKARMAEHAVARVAQRDAESLDARRERLQTARATAGSTCPLGGAIAGHHGLFDCI